MEEQNLTPEKIDIFPLVRGTIKQLKRTWWIGLILVLLAGGFGYFRSIRNYSPLYRVHASFIVTVGEGEIVSSAYYDKITTKQLNETFPYIMQSGALSETVAKELGYESLPVTITAQALGDTNIFQIMVTGQDPELISQVLSSLIDNYPTVAKYILGTTSLNLLEQSPVPTTPINAMSYKRQVAVYVMAALCLYLLFLAFRVMTVRTVQNKKTLYQYLNVPNYGSVPKLHKSSRRKNQPILIDENFSNSYYIEALQSIRSRLLSKMKEKNYKAIYITSSLAGEGKSTMACNLAILMAQYGYHVTLMDADLRNPSVAKTLGLEMSDKDPGLVDFLKGKAEINAILRKTQIPGLFVIPGGKPTGNIANLFKNNRFQKFLAVCKQHMDIIIVDTPPCSFIHDTAQIAESLDGGFLVVRQDYATIDSIVSGAEILAKTGAPLFGCAINFAEGREGGYGYGYGRYGYGKYGYGKKYGKQEGNS